MKTHKPYVFGSQPWPLKILHIGILIYSIQSSLLLSTITVHASQNPFILLLRSNLVKPVHLRIKSNQNKGRRGKDNDKMLMTDEDCIPMERRRVDPYKPCCNELTTENFISFLRDPDDVYNSETNRANEEDESSSYCMIRWNQEECQRSLGSMAENSQNIVLDGLTDLNIQMKPMQEVPSNNYRRRFSIYQTVHSMSLIADLGRSRIRKVMNTSMSGKKNTFKVFPSSSSKVMDKTKKEEATTLSSTALPVMATITSTTQLPIRKLVFWENMICGAISRSVAQTIMHPANTMKTILQSNRRANTHDSPVLTLRTLAQRKNLKMLTRGAGAQFVMSVPHGAVNFAVLEYVRRRLNTVLLYTGWINEPSLRAYGPTLDFISSAISTFVCSIVSTPQMMITDNIMAGTYPNFLSALSGLSKEKGLQGFYTGWWPGVAGKIPSYALTWSIFQQLKEAQLRVFKRPPKNIENSIMGCAAGGMTVCIMIPMDTIKTRLVTQLQYPDLVPYKGILDCAVRITKEEGIHAFYRGLTPRLISVVPMIGIQFGVYEFMKKVMVSRSVEMREDQQESLITSAPRITGSKKLFFQKPKTIEEVVMEVAADDDQPFPAPHRFDDEDK